MKRGGEQLDPQEQGVLEAARVTRRKTAFLLKKPFVEQADVYTLAKEFFKVYLQKPYEFTAQELVKEIHKVYLSSIVRDRVDAFVEKLSVMEYTDKQYSQQEIKELVQELDRLVKEMVVERQQQLPGLTRFANWLFRKKLKPKEVVISDFPAVEPNDRATIDMNTLLEQVYLALEQNKVKRAAHIYKELMARYNSLGPSAQQPFYHKLQAAYEILLQHSK